MSRLLSSKSSRDQLEGARRACAAALTGDESQYRLYFPCVVKSVGARSPDVRRLVYLFLSVAAERSANDALLCVNALKTELDGGSALGRGMALRALSSLRVPVIRPLVVLAARRGAGDVDVYVRRCAAMAAVKLASDAEEPEPELMDLLRVLLEDAASPVVGTAVVAFNAICPDNWEIIHPVYRKLCKALVDMDAWTQIAALSMLLRYARKHFAKPVDRDDTVAAPGNHDAATAPVAITRARFTSIDDFYADDGDDDEDSESPMTTDQGQTDAEVKAEDAEAKAEDAEDERQEKVQAKSERSTLDEPMQEDHVLLIRCARLILNSSNPGVVMAVASLMYHAAPVSEWAGVVRALVLAMRLSPHAAPMILSAIVKWAQDSPEIFKPFIRFFLVRASDDRGVRALKLEVLTLIADESNTANLLKEFQSYLRDSEKGFVADAVVALGHCAARLPSMSMPCMRALLRLSCYSHSLIADKSMMVMRVLAQSSPQVHAKGISKVLRKIDRVKSSSARAEAVWMIGGLLPPPGHAVSGEAEKLLGTLETAAQRALFSSAKRFAGEKDATKVQMLCASARLFVRDPAKMGQLHKYLLEVARYDLSYDVRDRARFLKVITSGIGVVEASDDANNEESKSYGGGDDGTAGASTDDATAVDNTKVTAPVSQHAVLSARATDFLFCPKGTASLPCVVEALDRFEVGSLSFMVRHCAPGYQQLADFPLVGTDPRIRDPPFMPQQQHEAPRTAAATAEPTQRADDFYDSESGSYTDDSGSYTDDSGSYTDDSGSYTDDSSDDEDEMDAAGK